MTKRMLMAAAVAVMAVTTAVYAQGRGGQGPGHGPGPGGGGPMGLLMGGCPPPAPPDGVAAPNGAAQPMGRGGRGRGMGAANGQRPNGQPPGPPMMNMMKALNITQDQMTQIRAISQEACTASQPLAEQANQLRRSLHDAIYGETAADPGAITSLVGQISALDNQLFGARTRTQAAIAAVLTAEQRAKLRGQ